MGTGGSMKNLPCDFPREKRNGFENLFPAKASEIHNNGTLILKLNFPEIFRGCRDTQQ